MGFSDRLGVALGNFIIRFRWLMIILTFAVVSGLAQGLAKVGFDTNYRVFFSSDNPQLLAFEELQAVYTKTDNVLFVIKPKDGDVFNPEVLELVQKITEDSWQLPFATRVDSITNYQHTYAEGDDLTVIDMVENDPRELNSKELKYIKDVVMKEPLLYRRLVSQSGQTTGVNVTFYLPGKSVAEVPKATAAAREIVKKYSEQYPNMEIRGSGIIYMNNSFSEASQNDLQGLIPLMYLILIIAMVIFLRCFMATISTVFVIAFSAVTAMGIAGFMGIKLTPPSATAPTIILTLAIADSIHVIISIFKSMQQGMTKRDAIVESLRINLQPIFLTSLTTAIGFLSLNFSDAPPFRDLGNMTAIGVMLAFAYSIIFLPAILSLLPINCGKQKADDVKSDFMDSLASFVIGARKKLFIVMSLVVIGLGSMIPSIELNDEFVKYFDHSIPFRGDTEFMIDNLTGIYQMEYSLDSGESQGISKPKYLAKVEEFANWLKQQPEVMHVYSITDIFKRLNKNMHGDDESWYRLPETREMAAQYLLLYEFSLPYGLDLNDRLNVDKSSTRLTATIDNLSTVEIRALKLRAEEWLKANAPKNMQTEATSPVIMFSYISERNIESMTRGNIIALTLISVIIMIALKSLKIGLFSLVPNLVPAIMGFGIWAILVGQINMAAAIVAAVSLGIIVDDTVHFLSKYFRARREKNLDAKEAVRYAFNTVGHALFVTTLVLVIGFSILVFSGFAINSTLGIMTAVTIACALIADFFLLPPLLIMLDKDKS